MIGIVTALTEEYDVIKTLMQSDKEERVSGMKVTTGLLNGAKVALSECGQGKVNAAACAELLIIKYKAAVLINVGIAGALAEDLSVGEVVIGVGSMQYDFDATGEGFELGVIPELGINTFGSGKSLVETALLSAETRGIKNRPGLVLTADTFLDNPELKVALRESLNGTVCEMEGAAVAQVGYLNNVPTLIIRSVTDTAEENAEEMSVQNLALSMENTTWIIADVCKEVARWLEQNDQPGQK